MLVKRCRKAEPNFASDVDTYTGWAEAVTLVAETHVPNDVYEEARREFTEKELVDLTYAIMAINAWNRLAVAFRRPPEHLS